MARIWVVGLLVWLNFHFIIIFIENFNVIKCYLPFYFIWLGPLPPTSSSKSTPEVEDEDEDDEEEEEEVSMVDKIPRSHEIDLKHGIKPITALCLDPSGARVVRY